MEHIPRLYRERPFATIAHDVQKLKDIEEGTIEGYSLTESEKKEFFDFEQSLGEQLNTISNLSTVSFTIYSEYLMTATGKKDFFDTFKISVAENVVDGQTCKDFISKQSEHIKNLDSKTRISFTGRSMNASIQEKVSQAKSFIDKENGSVHPEHIEGPGRFKIALTLDILIQKITALRTFKEHIKEKLVQVKETVNDEVRLAYIDLLHIYQRRINTLLATAQIEALASLDTHHLDQSYATTDSDSKSNIYGYHDKQRSLARFDIYTHGSDEETNDAGYYQQVGAKLLELANTYESESIDTLLNKKADALKKNVDSTKVEPVTQSNKEHYLYSISQIQQFAEATLAHYNLLSNEPADSYSSDRKGPATDEKWQVVISPSTRTMDTDFSKKVIFIPAHPQSAFKLFAVTLGHEIEVHVLQRENRSLLPLKICSDVGSGDTVIFSESGAKWHEDYISQNAFGYKSPPKPHYIRAMATKLQGGSFGDCVAAYLNSMNKGLQIQRSNETLTDEEFMKKCSQNLKTAYKSTLRLFKNETSESVGNQFLSNSKDALYLEGGELARAFQNAGMDEFLMLTGASIETIILLKKLNLLDSSSIRQPDHYALTLWENEKHKFAPV